MTKGRAPLPLSVVANRTRFSSPWVGLWPMTSPVEKHFQERTADTADLSTTLRSGRDDKGEGGASSNSSCGTGPVFHRLWGPKAHDSPVEMTRGRRLRSSVSGLGAGYPGSRRRPLDRAVVTRRRNRLQ